VKRFVFGILLVTLLATPAVFSDDNDGMEITIENAEHQMELRNMQLEMQQHEAEVQFKNRMRELELEKAEVQIERERSEFGRHAGPHKAGKCLFLLGCFIVHLLSAILVSKDIRARNCGSGIWVVIALLAGLFGVIAYGIIRLGDSNTNTKKKT